MSMYRSFLWFQQRWRRRVRMCWCSQCILSETVFDHIVSLTHTKHQQHCIAHSEVYHARAYRWFVVCVCVWKYRDENDGESECLRKTERDLDHKQIFILISMLSCTVYALNSTLMKNNRKNNSLNCVQTHDTNVTGRAMLPTEVGRVKIDRRDEGSWLDLDRRFEFCRLKWIDFAFYQSTLQFIFWIC